MLDKEAGEPALAMDRSGRLLHGRLGLVRAWPLPGTFPPSKYHMYNASRIRGIEHTQFSRQSSEPEQKVSGSTLNA